MLLLAFLFSASLMIHFLTRLVFGKGFLFYCRNHIQAIIIGRQRILALAMEW